MQTAYPAALPEKPSDEEKKAHEEAMAAHKTEIEAFAEQEDALKQITDLALLSNGLLKGKALSDFIARSEQVLSDAYLRE